MHVLILCNSMNGLYKFRKELLEELVKKSFRVTVSSPTGDFTNELRKIGCKLIPLSMDKTGTNPINELRLIKYYYHLISRMKPDVVLTYTIKPNVYGGILCNMLKIPYIVNITGLGTAVENKSILRLITFSLYRKSLKNAQKVFCQNNENVEFLLEHKLARKESISLLPGSGVNLNQYKVLPYPESDQINFVFISRLIKEKGIEQYLEAAERIHKKHPNVAFHICGGYENEYKERLFLLQKEGAVVLHGYVKDTIAIHKISSCTIHPTYYPEGMSNVLLESCACGRPIITTDRPGCREIIEDGINGYIVKQKDSYDLIEKIEKFLDLTIEEKRQMGIEGRKKVEREFDRKIVIDKYFEVISSLEKS